MTFRYEYKPQGAKSEAKKAAIIAIMFILVLSVYSIGKTITGYVSYSVDVESELNDTKRELAIYRIIGEECASDLWQREKNLTACEDSLASSSASLAKCNQLAGALANESALLSASLAACSSELLGLKGVFGSLNISYEKLVKTSVKAICCSFGDVQRETVKNWDVTPEGIVCSGSFIVNCSSGETF